MEGRGTAKEPLVKDVRFYTCRDGAGRRRVPGPGRRSGDRPCRSRAALGGSVPARCRAAQTVHRGSAGAAAVPGRGPVHHGERAALHGGRSGGGERSQHEVEVLRRSTEGLQEQLRSLDEDRSTMGNVLSSMEEGVVLVGPTGRVRLSNPAAERLLGTRHLTMSGVLPMAFQDAARKAAADGAVDAVEVETGSPSRWARATAIPVGDDGSVLLVVRDVTEAKRLEAVRRDFVANASHELKTPAASIQAAGETIRSAARDDPSVIPRFAEQ